MRRIFYLGAHQYEFYWWYDPIGNEDRLLFEDRESARDFLRSLLPDSFELGKLRSLVVERRRAGPLTGGTPDALILELARDLVEGRLRVTRNPRVYPVSLGT